MSANGVISDVVRVATWCGGPVHLEGADLVSWDQRFSDPIELPKGKKLVTLRDAALYIIKLPKAEHDAEELLAAMQALLLVAEHDCPRFSLPFSGFVGNSYL
jgi:hypothetical protein